MKAMELARRIGNIDDELVRQGERRPESDAGGGRRKGIRRILSVAVVAALMVCSFALGAFAMNGEPEMIEIEDAGITLILPDSWKGKYTCEYEGDRVIVYQTATHESDGEWSGGGLLFVVDETDRPLPMDYEFPMPGYVLASTGGVTYFLTLASDVQYDPQDEKRAEEYRRMYDEIGDIRILLSDWMKENSINETNWEEGTVYAELLNAQDGTLKESVICESEASGIISEILENQNYDMESAEMISPADMIIMLDGMKYYLDTRSGKLEKERGELRGTILSGEDLQQILYLVSIQTNRIDGPSGR